jgi:4'-phosphopantetheinyl transferase
MNRVILAYSRLTRQLPAALAAQWRARLGDACVARLRGDARTQAQTIAGVALACRLLSAASGREVATTELQYTPRGKPHAPGLPGFSIAHAGSWVLCALASEGAVGVDVEPLVARQSLPRWSQVFDAHERSAARTVRAALAIWTAKEATLKAAGATLAEALRVRVRGQRVEFRGMQWHCRRPTLAPRVMVSLVAALPITRVDLLALPSGQVLRT